MLTVKALDNGDGSIYKDTKKLEWVCNLNSTTSQVYYLQPGNYRIEWRSKALKGSIYTIEKKFTVNYYVTGSELEKTQARAGSITLNCHVVSSTRR